MPQVRLRSMDGRVYSIDTSSVETLSAWLRDTLPLVTSTQPWANECTLMLYPLGTPDGKADWPPERREDVIRPEDGERVYRLLDQIHAERYAAARREDDRG